MVENRMWTYINEQPEHLKKLLASTQIKDWAQTQDLKDVQTVFFIASGSSLNIARIAAPLFHQLAQVNTRLDTPFQFLQQADFLPVHPQSAIAIAISQTGTSSGTIQAVNAARKKGLKVLTLTERKETPMARLGDGYLNFLCGLEDCNAKTKGYSASLVLLWLVALEIGRTKGIVDKATEQRITDEIRESIDEIPATITKARNWVHTHSDWAVIPHFTVIGTSMNYGSAEEAALKMMETMCVPGALCETGEFSHGLHRTMDENSTVFSIRSGTLGTAQADIIDQFLTSKGIRHLTIDTTGEREASDTCIVLQKRSMTESALNTAVVFQVLACLLPLEIGQDPNREANDEFTAMAKTRE